MTPSIKFQIENRVTIFSNAIPESLITGCIEFIKDHINRNDYHIRFDYRDQKDYKVMVYDHYNNITSELKELFNSRPYELDEQKVIQVGSGGTEYSKSLMPYYENLIKSLYSKEIFYPDVQDFFYYGNGTYMNRHSDFIDNRLCTSILYLNDQNEEDIGGELLFYNDDRKVIYEYQPQKGDFVIMDNIEHSVNKIENWNRMTHRVYWNILQEETHDK